MLSPVSSTTTTPRAREPAHGVGTDGVGDGVADEGERDQEQHDGGGNDDPAM